MPKSEAVKLWSVVRVYNSKIASVSTCLVEDMNNNWGFSKRFGLRGEQELRAV